MSLPQKYSICFDLDGTIVDTALDLVRVLNTVIAEDGVPETDYALARAEVGYGAKRLIQSAFKRAERPLKDDRCDELLRLFLDLYAQDIAQLSRPFPGVMEVLSHLKQSGAELSVCTNKPGYLARPLLDALGMSPLFVRTIGSEDVPHKKPNAGHIFASAGHRGRMPIVMVGDSLPDILAAKAAKVPSVAVTYGYSPVPVSRLGADKLIRSFRELPSALKDVFA